MENALQDLLDSHEEVMIKVQKISASNGDVYYYSIFYTKNNENAKFMFPIRWKNNNGDMKCDFSLDQAVEQFCEYLPKPPASDT